MRSIVERLAAGFEQIRHMVDELFESADVSLSGLQAFGELLADRVENRRLHKAHRQQDLFGEHKACWRRNPWFVTGGDDNRRRHVQRAMIYLEAARRLDLAQLFFRRHAKSECFLERGRFAWAWIDEIDPSGLRQRLVEIRGGGISA